MKEKTTTFFRMRFVYRAGILFIGFCIIGYSLFLLSKSRSFQFFGGLTERVNTDKKVVAITFDDAPNQYSDDVVAILDEKQVKATFYMIGKGIEENASSAAVIATHGHEMGNHTYSHKRMVLKSIAFTKHEIERTNELIRSTGYQGPITFRPPYGKKLIILPWYLHTLGMNSVMCDVEPDTYVSGNADNLVDYVMSHTKPGSIILLHPFCKDQCRADREALPVIIDALREKGYTFLTVSQLLAIK